MVNEFRLLLWGKRTGNRILGGQRKDMELTREKVQEMAALDIRSVGIDTLTDLRDIVIDTKKPVPEKLASFAEQINVYVYRIRDYIVKVRFMEEGSTIDDKVEEYLRRLTEIHI